LYPTLTTSSDYLLAGLSERTRLRKAVSPQPRRSFYPCPMQLPATTTTTISYRSNGSVTALYRSTTPAKVASRGIVCAAGTS